VSIKVQDAIICTINLQRIFINGTIPYFI